MFDPTAVLERLALEPQGAPGRAGTAASPRRHAPTGYGPLPMSAFLLLVHAASAATCGTTVPVASVELQLEDVEASFGADVDSFRASGAAALALLPCVDAPLEPSVAARFHRVAGLIAFVDRDAEGAEAAFAAARALEPDHALLGGRLAEAHPLMLQYAARDTVTATEDVDQAAGVTVFDGHTTPTRPLELPTVYQRLDLEGVLATSALVRAGEDLPGLVELPVDTPPPLPITQPSPVEPVEATSRGPSRPLLVSAVASLAVSGGLYVGAGVSETDYFEGEHPDAGSKTAARSRTHALTLGSGVAAVAGVGLGVGAAWTWSR